MSEEFKPGGYTLTDLRELAEMATEDDLLKRVNEFHRICVTHIPHEPCCDNCRIIILKQITDLAAARNALLPLIERIEALKMASLALCDIIEECGAFAFFSEVETIRRLTNTKSKRLVEEK